jgi:hypothetical protein
VTAETPKELIEGALRDLAAEVDCTEVPGPDSHTIVVVAGLDDPSVPLSLARYAVGFLAGWVGRDALIAARLGVTGVENRPEVLALVDRIVSPDPGLDEAGLKNWRETWRDPWLAEVLMHALFVIHRAETSAFLAGGVVALVRPHPHPKRQGLDSLAIYDEEGAAVVAIGETKATRENASGELTNATGMFAKVDAGLFGPDLRDAIDILAEVLPEHLQSQVSDTLWRESRCYLPAVFHQSDFDATARRKTLADLKQPRERKRVLLGRLADFSAFFDAVASAMPGIVEEVVV